MKFVSVLSCAMLATTTFASTATETDSLVVPIPLPKYLTVEKSGSSNSLTAPSAAQAKEMEQEIAGGFTLKSSGVLDHGRGSNFQDLLKGTPGLFLQSENGVEVSKVSIRGSGILSEDEPLGVQFLLDGLPLNQADGEAILEDFDLATIKYAAVFRGSEALKYGSLTLGGAINLVSKTGYDADPLSLRVDAGSNGYWREQATAAGVAGRVDYITSVMDRRWEGFREHSQERLNRLTFNTGYRFNDKWENRLYLTLDRLDRSLPGGLSKDDLEEDPRQVDGDAMEQDFNKKFSLIRVADKIVFATDGQQLDAGLFWFHRNVEERGFFSRQFRQGITAFHSNNYGAVLNSVTTDEVFARKNVLTLGANLAIEREVTQNVENLDGTRGSTTARNNSVALNAPLYLENLHSLTDNLSLITAAQLIYARRKFNDKFLTDTQGDQSHSQTFHGANPKLSLIYQAGPQRQFFANLSRSWQPPSFDNMVEFAEGTNSSVVYRPLEPQRAWTLEVGTRGERGPWEWEFSVYQSRLHDELLDLNDSDGNEIGAVNVGRSQHRGVEAGFNVDLLELFGMAVSGPAARDRLTINQSYTFNDFRFRNDSVYGNNRIAGIPRQVYEAELLYQAACGFYAGPELQYIPQRYAVDQANTLFADAYALLSVKIGFSQTKKFSIFVEVKNLLNKRYAASIDPIAAAETDEPPKIFHPGQGRAVYSGVSWNW